MNTPPIPPRAKALLDALRDDGRHGGFVTESQHPSYYSASRLVFLRIAREHLCAVFEAADENARGGTLDAGYEFFSGGGFKIVTLFVRRGEIVHVAAALPSELADIGVEFEAN